MTRFNSLHKQGECFELCSKLWQSMAEYVHPHAHHTPTPQPTTTPKHTHTHIHTHERTWLRPMSPFIISRHACKPFLFLPEPPSSPSLSFLPDAALLFLHTLRDCQSDHNQNVNQIIFRGFQSRHLRLRPSCMMLHYSSCTQTMFTHKHAHKHTHSPSLFLPADRHPLAVTPLLHTQTFTHKHTHKHTHTLTLPVSSYC
jgi:hypothetical protein